MKPLLLLSAMFFGSLSLLFGQDLRLELPLDTLNRECHALTTGEDGLLLFCVRDSTAEPAYSTWSFQRFTNDLIRIWQKECPAQPHMAYHRHYWDGKYLHVLLVNEKKKLKRLYQIMSIHGERGDVSINAGEIPGKINIQDFSVVRGLAYLGGHTEMSKLEGYGRTVLSSLIVPLYFGSARYNAKPILKMQDLNLGQTEEFDFRYLGQGKVQHFSPNTRARYMTTSISHEPKRKENYVYVREYAGDRLIRHIEVDPKSDNRILTAQIAHQNRHEFMALGTYAGPYYEQRFWPRLWATLSGTRLTAYAHGIYVSKFKVREQEYIRFYNFTEFENFFKAYNKRTQKKIERKKRRKKRQRRPLLLDFNLLLHDVLETQDQYLLVAEIYKPEYREEMQQNLDGTRRGTGKQKFAGYRYTHAIAMAFDKENGVKLWDQSFPIHSGLTFNLQERVQVSVASDTTTFIYRVGGLVQSRSFLKGDSLSVKTIRPVPQEFTAQKRSLSLDQLPDEKSPFQSDMEYWYDRYFLAWGYEQEKPKSLGVFRGPPEPPKLYLYRLRY